MTYDRRGRPAPKPEPADEPSAPPAAAAGIAGRIPATPNAARLAKGGAAAAKAGAKRTDPTATGPGTGKAGSGKVGLGKAGAGKDGGGKLRAGRRPIAPRLLPLTALAVALVLTVKVGAVWERRADIPSIFSAVKVDVGAPAVAGNAKSTDQQMAANETDTSGKASAPAADGKVDPFALGKSQIELLQSLSERRKELDARERALEQREGLLAAAEHRIEAKVTEMKAIKADIEGLIKKYDAQEEQQIASLVKIYETMKPKDAARIFNELDMDVLLEVFERMKASKTAPVLASMDPVRAKEITTRIAERKKMPNIN